ncbi:hypothetical protein LB553_11635 [Mesorhizobium sp. CA8]|nr:MULTISPECIES: hypothetical protein [unclassified Mesorhizobium]MBZ9761524.1 hypothetical protein [Mesorhizobium sp. CA8]MBZ9821406.1 hypothetical protein [Mesorhizobium sp. CA4]
MGRTAGQGGTASYYLSTAGLVEHDGQMQAAERELLEAVQSRCSGIAFN